MYVSFAGFFYALDHDKFDHVFFIDRSPHLSVLCTLRGCLMQYTDVRMFCSCFLMHWTMISLIRYIAICDRSFLPHLLVLCNLHGHLM